MPHGVKVTFAQAFLWHFVLKDVDDSLLLLLTTDEFDLYVLMFLSPNSLTIKQCCHTMVK